MRPSSRVHGPVRSLVLAVLALAAMGTATAQEALLSARAGYFDLLALEGLANPPTQDYRTLSDDVWTIPDMDHPWKEWLSRPVTLRSGLFSFRLYGPDLFASWNGAYPHGMNDGALWQGVGLNTSLSTGFAIEAAGLRATFRPTVNWMQNSYFETLPGRGFGPYSTFARPWIDLYQRPGAASLAILDWGDSEIRYSLGPVTAGFGTQNVWMGPARRNPLIHSNNAEPYAKADFGIRRTPTPIGDIEGRVFLGQVHASEWFDRARYNDTTQVTGLSLSWSPSFLKGLTLGAHRIILSWWKNAANLGMIGVILFPWFTDDIATDDTDQRASVSALYRIPEAGLELYAEWGRNDFSTGLDFLIRYPFHTEAWTLGLRKAIPLAGGRWKGELLSEASNLESSRDYEFIGPTTFYEHWLVVQGHTNRGQIFGAGIGTGGNAQYLGFTLYHERGSARAYVQRLNRNNDYVYFLHWSGLIDDKLRDSGRFNAELAVGVEGTWFLGERLVARAGIAWCHNQNVLYKLIPGGSDRSLLTPNLHLEVGLSWRL